MATEWCTFHFGGEFFGLGWLEFDKKRILLVYFQEHLVGKATKKPLKISWEIKGDTKKSCEQAKANYCNLIEIKGIR